MALQSLIAPHSSSGDVKSQSAATVSSALVEQAIRAICASCDGVGVSVATPLEEDAPIIAVSEAFVEMSGYQQGEICGSSMRFLHEGCPVSPADMMGLRIAELTGAPFAAMMPNRKKSGEMFVHFIDVCGVLIGYDAQSGQPVWYLVGIHADVTGLDDGAPEDPFGKLQDAVSWVRERLRSELVALGQATDNAKLDLRVGAGCGPGLQIQLLAEPVWLAESDHIDDAGICSIHSTKMPSCLASVPTTALKVSALLDAANPAVIYDAGGHSAEEASRHAGFLPFAGVYHSEGGAPLKPPSKCFWGKSSPTSSKNCLPVTADSLVVLGALCAFSFGLLVGTSRR